MVASICILFLKETMDLKDAIMKKARYAPEPITYPSLYLVANF